MIYAFTNAAVNYLPKVRTLCRSIKQHHPEFQIVFALVDSTPTWLDVSQEPFDSVITLDELEIKDLQSWLFRHSIVELCTAIKPFVLSKLLKRDDCEAVFYFDPDMALFSRLDDLLHDLNQANIALTPHQTHPEVSLQAIIDNEICTLKHGIYNLGFIAVRQSHESIRFAAWWSERLYHFCRADIPEGLFTDQRWIDFVPVFFDGVKILKSTRFNVATWNLTTRTMTGDLENGFFVDERPLGFYHFTGFDKGDHKIMAHRNAPGNESVQTLIKWYENETKSSENAIPRESKWGYGYFDNGVEILPAHRYIYRNRRDLQTAFPNPFEVGRQTGSYYDWLLTQGVREHPDLLGPRPSPTVEITNFGDGYRAAVHLFKRMAFLCLRQFRRA